MKIVKREFARPTQNFSLWLMPTFMYIGLKVAGAIHPNKEWIWWVAIPSLICLWGLLNWKIKK
jgi:hypothetical protein